MTWPSRTASRVRSRSGWHLWLDRRALSGRPDKWVPPVQQGATGPQGPAGPPGTADIFGTDNNGSTVGSAAGAQCNLGDVQLTASVAVATDWLPAKGQTLTIAGNTALFSVMGTNYGGNGYNELRSSQSNGRRT